MSDQIVLDHDVTSDEEPTGAVTTPVADGEDEVVLEELLVEEVSIDGMCGVY